MADTSGQADIRGLDIDKLAKGFADEEILFKRFVTVSTTSAREILDLLLIWMIRISHKGRSRFPEATLHSPCEFHEPIPI